MTGQHSSLPEHGEIPFVTVGDSAFPSRVWLMKAFPDTTGDPAEINFNKKLRSARDVSEHVYGIQYNIYLPYTTFTDGKKMKKIDDRK